MYSPNSLDQAMVSPQSNKLEETFTKTIKIHGSTLLHTCFAPIPSENIGRILKRSKDDPCDYILTLEQLHYPEEICKESELTIVEQRPA